jgi:hypothetical protein
LIFHLVMSSIISLNFVKFFIWNNIRIVNLILNWISIIFNSLINLMTIFNAAIEHSFTYPVGLFVAWSVSNVDKLSYFLIVVLGNPPKFEIFSYFVNSINKFESFSQTVSKFFSINFYFQIFLFLSLYWHHEEFIFLSLFPQSSSSSPPDVVLFPVFAVLTSWLASFRTLSVSKFRLMTFFDLWNL